MQTVLEETTSDDLGRDHVVRRVADWAQRVDALYQQLEAWLPVGWTVKREHSTTLNEELMQKYQVPAHAFPVLSLDYKGQRSVVIEPRGLWIIGANGRLDIMSEAGHHVIVDLAEIFAPSDWRIASLADRRTLSPLTREAFLAAIRQ